MLLLICLPLETLQTFFKNKKRLENKNVKNVTKIKKRKKNVFYVYGLVWVLYQMGVPGKKHF